MVIFFLLSSFYVQWNQISMGTLFYWLNFELLYAFYRILTTNKIPINRRLNNVIKSFVHDRLTSTHCLLYIGRKKQKRKKKIIII